MTFGIIIVIHAKLWMLGAIRNSALKITPAREHSEAWKLTTKFSEYCALSFSKHKIIPIGLLMKNSLWIYSMSYSWN